MTLAPWLASRRPAPPADLAARLTPQAPGALPHQALATEGRARLDLARAHVGRVRESAFVLLEADALVTYACEAALETGDATGALRGVLAICGEG